MRSGELRHRVLLQTSGAVALAVSSITRAGAVATVVMAAVHSFLTNDTVTIAGATPADYNGDKKITVTSTTAFTFAVAGDPATPATGTITALFKTAAAGGTRLFWSELATVWGAVAIAPGARETLQAGQPVSQIVTEIRLRYRSDVTPKMRAVVDGRSYEIQSVAPDAKKTQLTLLALEVPA